MVLVMNSTIGSSIASGISEPTQEYFGISNDQLLVLPISIYLIGYVIGPLVFAVGLFLYVGMHVILLIFFSHYPNRMAGNQS